MDIHVPSAPKSLRITHTMWEDFLCDPVMATWVIFRVKLDAFQSARLRYYWWIQNVIDSSGFSSGKTIVDFIYVNLRAILIPDQKIGVYYPTFASGKDNFWPYFTTLRAPIFQSQLGRLDEKGDEDGDSRTESGGRCKAYYRNGNDLLMPSPSFMKAAMTQASLRFNTLLAEEWTHIDKMGTGIDDQLIGRLTRPSWNQRHTLWGNHLLLTAPAKTQAHPGYKRYKEMAKRVKAGDPAVSLLHYSYKDYSNLICHTGKPFKEQYRVESTIKTLKTGKYASSWLGEGCGVWEKNGTGWFTQMALQQCIDAPAKSGRNLAPVMNRAEMEGLVETWPSQD